MQNQNQEIIKKPYMTSLKTIKVCLSILEIGENIRDLLEQKIIYNVESRCVSEGFILPNSVHITSWSSGKINGQDVEFQVTFQYNVCFPVEGMRIECNVTEISKAGIHAEYTVETVDNKKIPAIIANIPRDIYFDSPAFNSVKIGETIIVRVIGVRFELNDKYITVLAELDRGNKNHRIRGGGDGDDTEDEEEEDDTDL